jgi:hypothetical protein
MEEAYKKLETRLINDLYKNVKKLNKSEANFTILIKDLISTARCADKNKVTDIAKETRERIVECLKLRKEARQHSKDTINYYINTAINMSMQLKPLSEAYGRCNNEDKSRVN